MLREAAERWRASERAITHWSFCSARTRAAIFLSKTLLTYGLIFIVDHSLRKLLHLAWTSALILAWQGGEVVRYLHVGTPSE